MNELIRMYNDQPVRIVEKDGETWFVAKDVAEILGYSDTAAMTRRLDDDEKTTLQVSQSGLNNYTTNITIINEPGLYNAILGSQKPEAKDFKRWVTHDVLPSIRQNGMYAAPAVPPQIMDGKTLQHLSTIMQSFSEMARENSMMSERISFLSQFAPKSEYGDVNREGMPRFLKRRGYFVANKGSDVTKHEDPSKSDSRQLDLFYDRLPGVLVETFRQTLNQLLETE